MQMDSGALGSLGFRVWGLGFGVWDLGFGTEEHNEKCLGASDKSWNPLTTTLNLLVRLNARTLKP